MNVPTPTLRPPPGHVRITLTPRDVLAVTAGILARPEGENPPLPPSPFDCKTGQTGENNGSGVGGQGIGRANPTSQAAAATP